MALSFTNGMTQLFSADSTTGFSATRFSGSGSAPGIATADSFVEGSGAIQSKLAGNNWDSAVVYDYYTQNGSSTIDLSSTVVSGWFKYSLIADTLNDDAGGLYLILSSSTETGTSNPTQADVYYLGGNNYYPVTPNGWVFFMIDTGQTTSEEIGTGGADDTIIRRMGVGVRNGTLSNIKGEPFWIDAMWSGTPLYTLNGDGTLVADWDDFVTESETTVADGLINDVGGAIHVRCGIQIGTNAQTQTTTFLDSTGKSIIFKRMLYHDNTSRTDSLDYAALNVISAEGAASFGTSVTLGTVVGTGDDRQGVLGGSIGVESSADQSWSLDFQTDIAHLTLVNMYGVTFTAGHGGLLFDGKATPADSSVVSCSFVNCGQVDTGAASNGVEMLNSFFIDPEGVTLNYGLGFGGTPSTGTLTTNVKQINFITSGTPATQYMTYLPESSDYTVAWADMQFFGSFTSGTLWHGLNDGTDADVIIAATGSTNAVTAEFDNTDVTGDAASVDVQTSVPVSFEAVDKANAAIASVQVSAYLVSDDTEVILADTIGSGFATTTFSGTTPADFYYRYRKSSTGATKYVNLSGFGTIEADTGVTVKRSMSEDTTADPSI